MNRKGFTLVEVVVALVLLACGIMAVQSAVVRLVHQVNMDTRVQTAVQLAEDRLELVRVDPQYVNLHATYDNSPTGEVNVAGVTGLTRVTTTVAHVDTITDASGSKHVSDYTRITVLMKGSGLLVPISRTVTVGAP